MLRLEHSAILLTYIKRCLVLKTNLWSLEIGRQASKIALVRSYLRVPQAAGQVKILIFLVLIKNPIYANNFCDAGQVPILRYFKAWPFYTGFTVCI